MEPKEYFDNVKSKVSEIGDEEIQQQLSYIETAIVNAHELGQKNALHKLAFTHEVLARELVLLKNGINKFVYREDISSFIDQIKVKKRRPIKVIELSRYPRIIPDANAKRIKEIKALDLFDDFVVVFTDFSDEAHMTPEEKTYVNRNRDPIVFGYFKHDAAHLHHERFYFVTDWEDEYCDLTFTKMIEEAGKLGIKNMEHTIKSEVDHDFVNSIIKDAREEMDKKNERPDLFVKKNSLFTNIKNWFSGLVYERH